MERASWKCMWWTASVVRHWVTVKRKRVRILNDDDTYFFFLLLRKVQHESKITCDVQVHLELPISWTFCLRINFIFTSMWVHKIEWINLLLHSKRRIYLSIVFDDMFNKIIHSSPPLRHKFFLFDEMIKQAATDLSAWVKEAQLCMCFDEFFFFLQSTYDTRWFFFLFFSSLFFKPNEVKVNILRMQNTQDKRNA